MEALIYRPRLVSFRTTSFHGDNKDASDIGAKWTIQLNQVVHVGLTAPGNDKGELQAIVHIEMLAQAKREGSTEVGAKFDGSYEAKFSFKPEVQVAEVEQLFDQEPYQYMLVAQAYPLAMMSFKREMQAMGFDARELLLGIEVN